MPSMSRPWITFLYGSSLKTLLPHKQLNPAYHINFRKNWVRNFDWNPTKLRNLLRFYANLGVGLLSYYHKPLEHSKSVTCTVLWVYVNTIALLNMAECLLCLIHQSRLLRYTAFTSCASHDCCKFTNKRTVYDIVRAHTSELYNIHWSLEYPDMWCRVHTLKWTDVLELRTASIITVTMEAVTTSETSVHFKVTTWRYIPDDSKLHTRRRENLKSNITCIARSVSFHMKQTLLFPVPVCVITASGVPGGTFVSMNRFSTLYRWLAQRQGWRVKGWLWLSEQPSSAKANSWLDYQIGDRKW
jgi:hypothetical protein